MAGAGKLQLKFRGSQWAQRFEFGGSKLKRNPSQKRPLPPGLSLHLVLRSSAARGRHSLLRYPGEVRDMVYGLAGRNGLQIYDFANVGSHLHILLKIGKNRVGYARFIRALSGLLARLALGAERGKAVLAAGKRFWDSRPYTRAVSWGAEFKSLRRYFTLNRMDAQGLDRINAGFVFARIADAGFA